MSTSVPNSYSNNEYGDMIKGDDAFHEEDDDISLEGLDDDDDISTISDASICIVCCILTWIMDAT
jgi:hypothetical protein